MVSITVIVVLVYEMFLWYGSDPWCITNKRCSCIWHVIMSMHKFLPQFNSLCACVCLQKCRPPATVRAASRRPAPHRRPLCPGPAKTVRLRSKCGLKYKYTHTHSPVPLRPASSCCSLGWDEFVLEVMGHKWCILCAHLSSAVLITGRSSCYWSWVVPTTKIPWEC